MYTEPREDFYFRTCWPATDVQTVYHRNPPHGRVRSVNIPVATIIETADRFTVIRYGQLYTGPTALDALTAFLAEFDPNGTIGPNPFSPA